jgi:hypothetical protein
VGSTWGLKQEVSLNRRRFKGDYISCASKEKEGEESTSFLVSFLPLLVVLYSPIIVTDTASSSVSECGRCSMRENSTGSTAGAIGCVAGTRRLANASRIEGNNSRPHPWQNLDVGRRWPSSKRIPQQSQKGRNGADVVIAGSNTHRRYCTCVLSQFFRWRVLIYDWWVHEDLDWSIIFVVEPDVGSWESSTPPEIDGPPLSRIRPPRT